MYHKDQHKQLKVAIYVRVSTEEQVEKYGKDLQLNAIKAFISSRGKLADGLTDAMVLAGKEYIYIDSAISGTEKLEERPAFAKLQEDIINADEEDRPFDIVAVYKIDRFARKLKILLNVIDFFDEYKLGLLSVSETIDTSNAFGRAILGIVGVLAELELETILERTTAGKAVAFNQGKFMGSSPPYGYIKDSEGRLAVEQEEAQIIKSVFDWFLIEQLPINQISKRLKQMEVVAPAHRAKKKRKGKINKKQSITTWNNAYIRDILINEIYIGKYYFGKTKKRIPQPKDKWQLSDYRHEPIIEEGQFLRAQQLLKSNSTYYSKRNQSDHIYLLGGLIKCKHCYDETRDKNEGMVSWHGDKKKSKLKNGSVSTSYSYRCSRKKTSKSEIYCETIPLPADQIEQYVVNRVKELLTDPTAVYNYQRNLESTQKQLNLLKKRSKNLTRIVNAYDSRVTNLKEQQVAGIISTKELKKHLDIEKTKQDQHLAELNTLRIQIAENTLSEGYIKSFEIFHKRYASALDDITKNREEVQRVLSMLIEKIVVHSRKATKDDVIAGRRSKQPHIPCRIDLHFKMPKEYMISLQQEIFKKYDFHNTDVSPEVRYEELTEDEKQRLKVYIQKEKERINKQKSSNDFGDEIVIW